MSLLAIVNDMHIVFSLISIVLPLIFKAYSATTGVIVNLEGVHLIIFILLYGKVLTRGIY